VVHDDAVGVVDDLGLVAELDGFAEASLGDRPGVRVVQTDRTRRGVGFAAGQPDPGSG
jgi:hypothetical protein